MEEVIKYFQANEARIAALEAEIAELKVRVAELMNRPAPEPQVVEKIVEKPVEVIKEVVVEKPVVVAAPVVAPEPEPAAEEPVAEPEPQAVVELEPAPLAEPEPQKEEPQPVVEEKISPKAAVYGKAVSDIRQAISLGDRFLYQRELFGQNAELMQRTLTELNELSSFDEALEHIRPFGWDQESNTYQQFLITLHRRFG